MSMCCCIILASLRVRDGFRNDDLHLRSRECRQSLGERNVVVPTGHDRDARCTAANRQLSFPPSNITPCARQTLASTAIAETADASDDGRLERGGVVPTVCRHVSWCGLQRFPEAEAGVADR